MTRRLGLSALSSLLLVLSFPRHDVEWLAWIALVPLLLAIRGERPARSFLLGYLTGIGFNIGIFSWINHVPGVRPMDIALLGLYLGSYSGVFAMLLIWISSVSRLSRPFLAPVLWVTLEYIRSNAGFMALPWALLGHSQYKTLSVIQIASVTGVFGVSFLVVLVNALIAEFVSLRVERTEGKSLSVNAGLGKAAAWTFAILALTVGYGWRALSHSPARGGVSVSVIQGNIAQDRKWEPRYRATILEKHLRLSDAAWKADRPALIVWPETAVPGSLPEDHWLLSAYTGLARRAGSHFLVGSSKLPKIRSGNPVGEEEHNSAFLFSPTGSLLNRYDKIRLLPFGEYLPGRDLVPWPSRYVSAVGQGCVPGREHTIFSLGGIPFGTVICWENLFPDLFRRFVKGGARFMINITNEAWFGQTASPYQFLSMAVFRAVENRTALVRAANTGISGFIDPYGRIMGTVTARNRDIFVEGYLTRTIPVREQTTFYTGYGDVFAVGNVAMAGVIAAASCMHWRRQRKLGTDRMA